MASEATIARDLRDARFQDALRIRQVGNVPAIDPAALQAPSSAVERDIDSLRQAPHQGLVRGQAREREIGGAKPSTLRTRNLAENLNALRKIRQSADLKGDLAKAAVNRAYTFQVNAWQSELLANVLALEVFVSPWVFLLIFFMRVMASLVPVRVRGIDVIPPYTLKGGGIGVLIAHLAGALGILVVLTIIIILIALIAIFITHPLDQIKTMFDLATTGLQVLYDLVTK